MTKGLEMLEILKQRNDNLKINHKIGSRDIANQEIKEISPEIAFVSEGRIVIESYLPKNIKNKEIYRG